MASGSASCGATTKSATIEQVATDRAMVGSEFFKFLDVMLVVWASATGAIGQKFYGDLVLRPLPDGIHMETINAIGFWDKKGWQRKVCPTLYIASAPAGWLPLHGRAIAMFRLPVSHLGNGLQFEL